MIKRITLLFFIGFAWGQLIDELETLNDFKEQFLFQPENLYKSEGLWYTQNSDDPFTGRLTIYSRDLNKNKVAECTIVGGLKNGFFIQYYNNIEILPGIMGLYINDKKEGAWTWIETSKSYQSQKREDSDFQIITSIDYRDGMRHGSIIVHKVNLEEFGYMQNYSYPRNDMFLKGQYFNGEKKGEWYYDDHLYSDFDRFTMPKEILKTPFYWSRKEIYDKDVLINRECIEPWDRKIDCNAYEKMHRDEIYLLPSLDYLVEKNIDVKMKDAVYIKDNKGINVEIDLKEFVDHIDQYHHSVDSIHEERGYSFIVNDNFRKRLNQKIELNN